MIKRIIILFIVLGITCFCQARIARFYFSKAYLASGTADKYDTPVPGTYIITFNTTAKTISLYYKAYGYQPYQFTTKYKSVKEYHGKSENTDYYTLAGLLYNEDTYTIANSYDKTTRTYSVSFTTTHFMDGDMFSREFLGYFGAPSDWRCWPEVFFENPYKHESIPDSGKKKTSTRTLNSLENHIYAGTYHHDAENYMDATLVIHFVSATKCRMKLTSKLKGTDEVWPLQIIQMMLEAEGEDSYEGIVNYSVRNGTVIIQNSTDRFKILNGGRQLRYFIDSSDADAKKFYAILDRIQ